MKKFFIFLLIIIISVPTVCYADNMGFDTIKLGLFFGNTAKERVNLSCDGGFLIGYENNGSFVKTFAIDNTEISVFVNENGKLEIQDVGELDGNIMAVPAGQFIKIEGNTYRGSCILALNSEKINVINKVNTEEYLYSVLGKEMSPSWPIEALKAQAICARSYAYRNRNKFAAYGFNLCTTTVSQVYGGTAYESSRTIDAVNQTKGQLLKYNGQVAETLYFASDGGYTADAKYVWGSSVPYLVAKKDPYEVNEKASYGTWSVTYTKDDIKSMLAGKNISIGEIKNVLVKETDLNTVYEVEIVGTDGVYTVKNDNITAFFKLKSQYFEILSSDVEQNIINSWDIVKNVVNDYYANEDYEVFRNKLGSSPSGTFIFNGRGYGHRVGLSQCGARDMALSGFSAYKILDFYYTGTYVE